MSSANERRIVFGFSGVAYPLFLLLLFRSPSLLNLCQSLTIPLYLISRAPQLYTNYMTKSTGQLSAITFFANMLGSLVRLMDKQIRADPVLLIGFIISVSLNASLVAQIVMYRANTRRMNKLAAEAAAAKPTKADAQSAAPVAKPASSK